MTYTEAIQQHSKISTIKALHVDLETGLFEILHLNELEPKSKNNLLSEWTKKYVDGRHISDEQLSLLVQKARNLGMPEKYIQDALAFIKSLKNN